MYPTSLAGLDGDDRFVVGVLVVRVPLVGVPVAGGAVVGDGVAGASDDECGGGGGGELDESSVSVEPGSEEAVVEEVSVNVIGEQHAVLGVLGESVL